MLEVRSERPDDYDAVRRVNEVAFGGPSEAALVDALREVVDCYVSLVAVEDSRIVGHIFFSPVTIEGERTHNAMGLAPMAVLPEFQRGGVGSLLVRAGLDECHRLGHSLVVVLGHAEYYPRFGFRPASVMGLRSKYAVPDEVFMAMELTPGASHGVHGLVKYHSVFDKFE